MKKPKIKISLIDQKGHMGCHRGHRIGDTFDFDTERGALCPMAMHVAFPYIDILRYGGKLPSQPDGSIVFCCPDVDVINVFKIEGGTFYEYKHHFKIFAITAKNTELHARRISKKVGYIQTSCFKMGNGSFPKLKILHQT